MKEGMNQFDREAPSLDVQSKIPEEEMRVAGERRTIERWIYVLKGLQKEALENGNAAGLSELIEQQQNDLFKLLEQAGDRVAREDEKMWAKKLREAEIFFNATVEIAPQYMEEPKVSEVVEREEAGFKETLRMQVKNNIELALVEYKKVDTLASDIERGNPDDVPSELSESIGASYQRLQHFLEQCGSKTDPQSYIDVMQYEIESIQEFYRILLDEFEKLARIRDKSDDNVNEFVITHGHETKKIKTPKFFKPWTMAAGVALPLFLYASIKGLKSELGFTGDAWELARRISRVMAEEVKRDKENLIARIRDSNLPEKEKEQMLYGFERALLRLDEEGKLRSMSNKEFAAYLTELDSAYQQALRTAAASEKADAASMHTNALEGLSPIDQAALQGGNENIPAAQELLAQEGEFIATLIARMRNDLPGGAGAYDYDATLDAFHAAQEADTAEAQDVGHEGQMLPAAYERFVTPYFKTLEYCEKLIERYATRGGVDADFLKRQWGEANVEMVHAFAIAFTLDDWNKKNKHAPGMERMTARFTQALQVVKKYRTNWNAGTGEYRHAMKDFEQVFNASEKYYLALMERNPAFRTWEQEAGAEAFAQKVRACIEEALTENRDIFRSDLEQYIGRVVASEANKRPEEIYAIACKVLEDFMVSEGKDDVERLTHLQKRYHAGVEDAGFGMQQEPIIKKIISRQTGERVEKKLFRELADNRPLDAPDVFTKAILAQTREDLDEGTWTDRACALLVHELVEGRIPRISVSGWFHEQSMRSLVGKPPLHELALRISGGREPVYIPGLPPSVARFFTLPQQREAMQMGKTAPELVGTNCIAEILLSQHAQFEVKRLPERIQRELRDVKSFGIYEAQPDTLLPALEKEAEKLLPLASLTKVATADAMMRVMENPAGIVENVRMWKERQSFMKGEGATSEEEGMPLVPDEGAQGFNADDVAWFIRDLQSEDEERVVPPLLPDVTPKWAKTAKVTLDKALFKNLGEGTVHVKKNETYTLDQLFHHVLVRSDVVAARALRKYVKDTYQLELVDVMNYIAQEQMGLRATTFADCSGMSRGNQSTAGEFARFFARAARDPYLARVMGTEERSTNRFLREGIPVIGKTGTLGAGCNFVGKVGENIFIILNAPDSATRWRAAETLRKFIEMKKERESTRSNINVAEGGDKKTMRFTMQQQKNYKPSSQYPRRG